jgi:hypothetical protein
MKIRIAPIMERTSNKTKKRSLALLYWRREFIFGILIFYLRVEWHFFGNRIQPLVSVVIKNTYAIGGGVYSEGATIL